MSHDDEPAYPKESSSSLAAKDNKSDCGCPHEQKQPTPPSPSPAAAGAAPGGCPVDHKKIQTGCPVDHTKLAGQTPPHPHLHQHHPQHHHQHQPHQHLYTQTTEGSCPVDHTKMQHPPQLPANHPPATGGIEKCPVQHQSGSLKTFDYLAQQLEKKNIRTMAEELVPAEGSEELDERNMMPKNPKQRPHPDQKFPLTTERVVSSIPKTGEDGTWVYPSRQMFYNAVKRKGGSADEEAMSTVVAVHNAVNEHCWQQILRWEALHCDECPNPTLSRFRGRYTDLSPKAKISMWMGWERPFDRHDWVVDRCGREVRYVIDYYATGSPNPQLGGLDMILDVRPALDSPSSFWDRLRMFLRPSPPIPSPSPAAPPS